MDDLRVRQALREYVRADEPPLNLTASGLLTKGKRQRVWRAALGVGGGGAVTALAVTSAIAFIPELSSGSSGSIYGAPLDVQAVCGVTLLTSTPSPRPIAPGKPPLVAPGKPPLADESPAAESNAPSEADAVNEAAEAGQSAPPSPEIAESVPVEKSPVGAGDYGSQVPLATEDPRVLSDLSCHLAEAVSAKLPDATFARLYGKQPLVAYGQMMSATQLAYEANARVMDDQGISELVFSITAQNEGAGIASDEALASKGFTRRTGPNGEDIQVADLGPDSDGVHIINIYVYTGRTIILATVSNSSSFEAPQDGVTTPTRDLPVLTLDQLIELATDPALAVYG